MPCFWYILTALGAILWEPGGGGGMFWHVYLINASLCNIKIKFTENAEVSADAAATA